MLPIALLDKKNKDCRTLREAFAERCRKSFLDMFMNEYGYLFDYVGGNDKDWSVRPNMVFVALDYSPLEQDQKRAC